MTTKRGCTRARDAVVVAVMKQYGAFGIADKSVLEHRQFKLAEEYGLVKGKLNNIELKASELTEDEDFDLLLSQIKSDLR